MRKLLSAISAVVVLLSAGCGYKYTIVADNNLKLSTMSSATVAVLPMPDLYYNPPESCLFPPDMSAKPEIRHEWNERIKTSLHDNFPGQKFVFLEENKGILGRKEYQLPILCAKAENSIVADKISQSQSSPVLYTPMGTNSSLSPFLKDLKEQTGAQYAVIFLTPALTGEIQNTYNPGPYGGSFNSTTYYTADIQIQLWDCSSSKLMYSSGGWNKSAGYCFFLSPESAAMQNSTNRMLNNLHKTISFLLEKLTTQTARSIN